jgi:hypothetical protein
LNSNLPFLKLNVNSKKPPIQRWRYYCSFGSHWPICVDCLKTPRNMWKKRTFFSPNSQLISKLLEKCFHSPLTPLVNRLATPTMIPWYKNKKNPYFSCIVFKHYKCLIVRLNQGSILIFPKLMLALTFERPHSKKPKYFKEIEHLQFITSLKKKKNHIHNSWSEDIHNKHKKEKHKHQKTR